MFKLHIHYKMVYTDRLTNRLTDRENRLCAERTANNIFLLTNSVSPLKYVILPILKQGRNYPDDTWVFMLAAVCQMGVFVRTPTAFVVRTSGIFLILKQRRNTCS